jgi:hypothetical protein
MTNQTKTIQTDTGIKIYDNNGNLIGFQSTAIDLYKPAFISKDVVVIDKPAFISKDAIDLYKPAFISKDV